MQRSRVLFVQRKHQHQNLSGFPSYIWIQECIPTRHDDSPCENGMAKRIIINRTSFRTRRLGFLPVSTPKCTALLCCYIPPEKPRLDNITCFHSVLSSFEGARIPCIDVAMEPTHLCSPTSVFFCSLFHPTLFLSSAHPPLRLATKTNRDHTGGRAEPPFPYIP
ncbi:unnamed protein product, partial [Ectocarpus fasciculatus]